MRTVSKQHRQVFTLQTCVMSFLTIFAVRSAFIRDEYGIPGYNHKEDGAKCRDLYVMVRVQNFYKAINNLLRHVCEIHFT